MKSDGRVVLTKRFWVLLISLAVIAGAVLTFSILRINAARADKLAATSDAEEPSTQVEDKIPENEAPTETPAPPAEDEKVVYLTFDDGPSAEVTPQILDTLKQYNVPATFFLLGNNIKRYPDLVKREHSEGHKLANHGCTHDYKKIYASAESLMNEIKETNQDIDNALGIYYGNTLFRFPGGSFGRTEFKDTVTNAGYKFVDWNCLGKDAEGKQPKSPGEILQAVKDTAKGQMHITVLLHDASTKKATADALPMIIEYFTQEGYSFRVMENN